MALILSQHTDTHRPTQLQILEQLLPSIMCHETVAGQWHRGQKPVAGLAGM